MYFRWAADKLWSVRAGAGRRRAVHRHFKEFPPSQKSGSFSVDQVLEQLQTPPAAAK